MKHPIDDTPTSLAAADIMRLLDLLPHRYPFLLVDRILEMRGDEFGIGLKNVTFNEPFFQGHFPGTPVMPGVLQIEGMAQTAGAMCMAAANLGEQPQGVYFMAIDKAKFRRVVTPGDQLFYHLTKLRRRFNVWKYQGEARVNGEIVAEAQVTAMVTNRTET
ncbi:3-hydroxyacyl-[acyl-carrier-protein] dehydratase, FabZ form [hydrothermal vent metagenome]|uniref:3-hydroxyacyl-[acyl-carrier-protein] dehydratase n=1 Tax=hydrothermal vent metagenome TaxID=652676 RepID=A0A3B0SVL4_9ZZZZ